MKKTTLIIFTISFLFIAGIIYSQEEEIDRITTEESTVQSEEEPSYMRYLEDQPEEDHTGLEFDLILDLGYPIVGGSGGFADYSRTFPKVNFSTVLRIRSLNFFAVELGLNWFFYSVGLSKDYRIEDEHDFNGNFYNLAYIFPEVFVGLSFNVYDNLWITPILKLGFTQSNIDILYSDTDDDSEVQFFFNAVGGISFSYGITENIFLSAKYELYGMTNESKTYIYHIPSLSFHYRFL